MLPKTMTVIEANGAGGPEVLVPATRPVPEPGPGEVLIEVAAAGINRPDVLQRQGLYPAAERRLGSSRPRGRGQRRRASDRRCRPLQGSAIPSARWSAAAAMPNSAWRPKRTTLPVPQGLGMIEAAALPETVFTVWHNVFERAALKPGEWLLVHGGTSGIGTTAIQIGAALGAKVIVTVGSAEKVARCRGARRRARRQLSRGGFRRGGARDDRRSRRRCHSRHGWRRLYRARPQGRGARRPHRADRLPQGLQGRDRSDAADDAAADAHRLDAARADAPRPRRAWPRRSRSASGR